jgi:RNA polymerase sigma-70 factor (sigma-E family)
MEPFQPLTCRRGVITTGDTTDDPTGAPETAADPRNARRLALEHVYAAEHASLVRTASLISGSQATGEDLVQEAFAKLYPRIDHITNPAAWLRTVVVNGARNDIRRMIVRRRFLAEHAPLGNAISEPESRSALIESLRRLPGRQRAVVVLRFYEDRSEQDIADVLGVRLGTVKSSLHRALATLRQEMEQ